MGPKLAAIPLRGILGAWGPPSSVYSHDEIRLEGTREGTRVTYDAQLELKGLLALADPILGLVFRSVGDKAVAGLRTTLGG